MKKENIMSLVLGLAIGLVAGFAGANSMNKSAYDKPSQIPPPATSTGPSSGNPALPPDHPPLGTSSGEQPQAGPRPEVMAAIDKAKAKPTDFEAQMTAADLYYQIERFEDAAKFYEIASKLKPADPEPMIKAGNAFFDSEKYEEAEKWYTSALQKDPKNINVRTDLGLTFFQRSPRDIDRAIKEYQTALSQDPENEITLQNLAIAYSENGDNENLRATVEKLKKVNPKNPALAQLEAQ